MALECSDCLLGLQITNGTEWLQIGGRDDTFLPIVIKDSQVSLVLFSTVPGGNNQDRYFERKAKDMKIEGKGEVFWP